MRSRMLGKTGLEVSEVGLGTSKGLVEKMSPVEGVALIKKALDPETAEQVRECYRLAKGKVG